MGINSFVVIVCIFALFAGGCQSVHRIAIESEYLKAVNRTGAPIETIKTIGLTDAEMIQVTRSANVFAAFNDKWKSPTDALRYGGNELKQDYLDLRQAYIEAYAIANDNWVKYSMQDRQKMSEWHKHALALDEAAKDYEKVEKYVDMADQLIDLSKIGVSLLLRLPI